ncbi:unnamed protein product [Echinostoma caproni]|uniref:LRP2-binding protein n=1 Tax=Echinostoma caproni TaxID=27848 RepID=A0A183AMA1_9TREM|nr:unnamed protein product [Echinostoma caproni]
MCPDPQTSKASSSSREGADKAGKPPRNSTVLVLQEAKTSSNKSGQITEQEMDDLLRGLPREIPAASLPRISLRIVKELEELGVAFDTQQLDYQVVDSKLEQLLTTRIERGDDQAPFQLGQIFFEKAEACKLFMELTELKFGPKYPTGQRELVYHAAYNLGRAYHQGFGVYPSDEKALEYFLLAANEGDKTGCVYAQTALGYLYSGEDLRDLKKSFYWHSEACGNGSVESQVAAIGVMYLYGLGVEQDWNNALICLSEAANRGSLYAKASLVYLYYKRKMYSNAAALANNIKFDSALACRYQRMVQLGEL